MEENGSPQRLGSGQNGYNRLSTLEMENQGNANTEEDSIFMQHCRELQQQLGSGCHMIDWDCIFRTTFFMLWIVLILTAFFFPIMKTEMNDQQFQHQFMLDSLTISEFQASPAQVTGKCDTVLKITNLGDRSIYHESSVVSIFLDHELLWVTRTGDFFLEVGSRIMFNVSMNTTTISVPASFVPTALLESQKLRKPLHFKLKYDGMVREGLDSWHEERSHLYVVCGWIEMQFVDETTIKGGPASCSIENY